MLISNCCGAANKSNGDTDYAEFGICPECKEHCEFIDEDSLEDDGSLDIDPDIELRSDNWGTPGSQDYMMKLKNLKR